VRTLRRLGVLLLLTGLALGWITSGAGLAQSKVIIVDDRGKEIEVPLPVERIVVAGTPLYTEILIDLGAKDLIVGVTESPDNPPEVSDVPRVGPPFQPNVETILALEPDVVLGAIGDVRDQLEAAGLIVVTPVLFIQSLPDIFSIMDVIGLIAERAVEAELLIGRISERIVRVESAVVQRDRVRAAFLFAPPDMPPFAVGRGSVEGELLARAGAENVFADIEGVQQVSFEAVVERDPDVIFTDPAQIENLLNNPLLRDVKAVRDGRVVGVKASALTSTRVAEALRAMAEALHPDAFR
jgi:iron complex transport system substrate-binding protein